MYIHRREYYIDFIIERWRAKAKMKNQKKENAFSPKMC